MVAWIPYDGCHPEVFLLLVVQVKQPQHAHVFVRQPFVHIFFDTSLPLQRLFVQLLLHELIQIEQWLIFEYDLLLTLEILVNNPVHYLEWF